MFTTRRREDTMSIASSTTDQTSVLSGIGVISRRPAQAASVAATDDTSVSGGGLYTRRHTMSVASTD